MGGGPQGTKLLSKTATEGERDRSKLYEAIAKVTVEQVKKVKVGTQVKKGEANRRSLALTSNLLKKNWLQG